MSGLSICADAAGYAKMSKRVEEIHELYYNEEGLLRLWVHDKGESGMELTSKGTIYNLILDEIREGIKEGRYKSGDKIKETDLCRKFNVSRTPIREAIRQLQIDGFLVHVPQRGVQIPKLEGNQMLNYLEIRMELEKLSAYNAAFEAAPDDIKKLRELNEGILELGKSKPESAVELDETFHLTIAGIGKNPYIKELLANIYLRSSLFGHLLPFRAERIPYTYKEHDDIIFAVEKNDAELAKKYMDVHFYCSTASIKQKLINVGAMSDEAHGGNRGGK